MDASESGRFVVVSELGRGGMGVVHLAWDRERRRQVALKRLRRSDPGLLYRLKREFRARADMHHPNLVRYDELLEIDGHLVLCMEFVDGSTLDELVWSARESSETSSPDTLPEDDTASVGDRPMAAARAQTQARSVLPSTQIARIFGPLALGLHALHNQGLLHRDIKPSNVIVSRTGRPVLLDFGLVVQSGGPAEEATTQGTALGTVRYMSPEQMEGTELQPPSDWYSFGVVLFEVLTGTRPFGGSYIEVHRQKTAGRPPRIESADPTTHTLGGLAWRLLAPAPGARPSGQEILAVFNALDPETVGPVSESVAATTSLDDLRPPPEFVGRTRQRAALRAAWDGRSDDGATLVFLSGPSGMGKSTLADLFLGDLADQGATVLRGRCFERDTMPFKAFDAVLDLLHQRLRKADAQSVHALLPRYVGELLSLFPVLARVPAFAAAGTGPGAPDPQERRRRGFVAVRDLLARMAEREPLAVVVDDLQWADPDSVVLLRELVRRPDAPRVLLLLVHRDDPAMLPPWLTAWRDELLADGAASAVTLPPLADEAVAALMKQLGHPDWSEPGVVERVNRECSGHPYLLTELLTREPSGPHAGDLDALLTHTIDGLTEEQRVLLEVIAMTGVPIARGLAATAADTEATHDAFDVLESARLIRCSGIRRNQLVAPYHDRVRETVLHRLPERTRKERHSRIASALLGEPVPPLEAVAFHLSGAGREAEAGAWTVRAARSADRALAFERAAALYARAIVQVQPTGEAAVSLHSAHAEVLSKAGHGSDAGTAYLAAANACAEEAGLDALELRRRAAEELLFSGEVERGTRALEQVLGPLGLTFPASPRAAIPGLLWRRLLTRFGVPRGPSSTPPTARDLLRIDACQTGGVGLHLIDPIRSAHFQSLRFGLAVRAGEPGRLASALVGQAVAVSLAGVSAEPRARAILEAASEMVEAIGDPALRGLLRYCEAMASLCALRMHRTWEHASAAAAIFEADCVGEAARLSRARQLAAYALARLGRYQELSQTIDASIEDARRRGDKHALNALLTNSAPHIRLAQDQPERVRETIAATQSEWPQGVFLLQHHYAVYALVLVALYTGAADEAAELLARSKPDYQRSLFSRVESIRVDMNWLRTRAALAQAAANRSARAESLRRAERLVRQLRSERPALADAYGLAGRVGLRWIAGDVEGTVTALDDAIVALDANQKVSLAATARMLRARVVGEPEDVHAARLRELGVVAVDRYSGMMFPGLGGAGR